MPSMLKRWGGVGGDNETQKGKCFPLIFIAPGTPVSSLSYLDLSASILSQIRAPILRLESKGKTWAKRQAKISA